MSDKNSHIPLYERSPLYQLVISLLVIFVAGIALFTVSVLAGKVIFHSDLGVLGDLSLEVTGNDLAFLKYILIFQDISLFIVPAIIIFFLLKPRDKSKLLFGKVPQLNEAFLVILLAFCVFPVTSFTGQLNSGMHLPDWLSGVENWMTEKESSANRLIDLCMASDTFAIMILNLVVVAVLPAIGEELIFRGVIQKILSGLFTSGHSAIWLTAFVFSAIHFQFYGFVPRIILGLIFGYLFFWSGKLWLPVIAHFVNNAVPTIGVYISGMEKFNSPSDIPVWKQLVILPLPMIVIILILMYFRNKSKPETGKSMDHSQLANN